MHTVTLRGAQGGLSISHPSGGEQLTLTQLISVCTGKLHEQDLTLPKDRAFTKCLSGKADQTHRISNFSSGSFLTVSNNLGFSCEGLFTSEPITPRHLDAGRRNKAEVKELKCLSQAEQKCPGTKSQAASAKLGYFLGEKKEKKQSYFQFYFPKE